MSIAPRGSQARRRSLREGGRRVALLVAVAGIAGPATLAPSPAGSAPLDACDGQPAGVSAGADGQDLSCDPAAPSGASADPGSGPDPSADSPTTPSAPPVGAPADPGAASGDGGEPAQDDAPGAPVDAASAATPPQPGDGDPGAAAQPSAGAGAAPDTGTPSTETMPAAADGGAPAVVAAPTAAAGDDPADAQIHHERHRDGAHPSTPAATHGDRDHQAQGTGQRREHHNRRAQAEPAERDGAGGAVITGDPIPSEWASLEPIVLPPFSLDDFPVPAHLLPLYQAAAAEYGLPWEVLAAINEVETAYGRNVATSSAGAVGFMQFLPSTWERWGRDADGDRRRDPDNPADAIFSAARYLHAAGAAEDLGRAIFAYNHSNTYVNEVVTRARELAGLDADQVSALTARALEEHRELYEVGGSPFFGPGVVDPTPGQVLLMTEAQLTRLVLKDERIDLYACGRQDVEAGRVGARVLATLMFLVESGYRLQVSSLECGHGRMTSSGNVSAHSYGSAVDIAAVNGTPIAGHQGPGSITEDVLRRLVHLQGRMRPNQIISLMTIDQATNTLAMADHADHIHVGFPRAVELR